MGEKLLLIPWFAGIGYSTIPLFWFVIHPLARRWQRSSHSPYHLLLSFWAVEIGILASATWPWHGIQVYDSAWMWLPASLLFLTGLPTYSRIARDFGIHNFIGQTELRPGEHKQVLVTSGLHKNTRHPIYLAHLSMLAAWTVGSGLLVNFVLLAASAFVTFPLMIWLEERELEQRFGQSFLEYKARVPLFRFSGWRSRAGESPWRGEEQA